MATGSYTNLASISDDATYRAWAQGIHDVLAASGLVQSADAGQINIATAARPAAGNGVAGYEVWRFADSLAADYPIYIKIEYSISGSAPPANPQLYWTVGKGSDGNGNLTGILVGRWQMATFQSLAANSVTFASHAGSSFTFAMNIQAGGADGLRPMLLAIDRLRAADGTPTPDIFVVQQGTGSGAATNYVTALHDGSAAHAWAAAHGPPGLMPVTPGSTLYKGDTYSVPLFPFLGYPRNPTVALQVASFTDVGSLVTFQVPVYGTPRTYRMTSMGMLARGGTSPSTAIGVALRYE